MTTVFRAARVFDGQSFLPGPHDVIVRSGVITQVAPSASRPFDPVAGERVELVECSGRTLVPGFVDAHVHMMVSRGSVADIFDKPFSMPYYDSVGFARTALRSGVTTVRDAGFADAGMRDSIARGVIEGPRMKVAITIVSMTGGHGDMWLRSGIEAEQFLETPGRPAGIADGPDELLKITRRLFRAGADQIKICTSGGVLSPNDEPEHSQFNVAEIRTVVDEAATHGSYVMAHATGAAGIRRGVQAGVRSVEHGIYLDNDTIEQMVVKGVYLVPTLTAPRQVIDGAAAGVVTPPQMLEKAKRVRDVHQESFARAVAAGIKIAMGSDAGVGPHGQSLEELAAMAESGMSLEAALRAGTSTAAELLCEADSIGSLTTGRQADLVLLDLALERAEQLAGLRERVIGVWKAGRRVVKASQFDHVQR